MAFVDLGMTDDDALDAEERARRELEERRAQARALIGDMPDVPRVEMPESPSRPGQAAEAIGEAARASGRMSAPATLHRADGGVEQVPPQPLAGRIADVDARLAAPGGRRAVEQEMRREAVPPPAPPPAPPVRRVALDDEPPMQIAAPRRVSLGDEPMQIAPRAPGPASSPARGGAVAPPVEAGPPPVDAAMARKPRELARPTGADALDAGLPSQGDIDRERGIDVPRRILHALGAALSTASGRSARPFESRGDALAAQRAQGMAQRMGVKREDVQRQQEASAEAAEQRAESDIAGRRLASQEAAQLRDDERQSRMTDAQVGMMSSRQALTDEQTATARRSSARDAMLDDPASEASRAARTMLRARISGLGERDPRAQAILRDLGGPDGIERMTGRDAMAYLEHGRLPPSPQMRGGRAGGDGSGGGGGQRATDDEALVRDAMQILNYSEGSARAAMHDPAARRSIITQLGRQGSRDRMADEGARIPGYTRRPDARRLSAQQARSVSDIATADREFRSIVQMLERDLGSLTAAERAGGVSGLGSERYARIQHGLDVIRNQFRQINSAGNSLGAQQMAEHAIPDLTARTTVEALLANVRAAQEVKHRYVAAVLEQFGYEPDGGGGGHGGGHTATPSAGPTVAMTLPDGSTRQVPERAVEAARRRGWEVAQ